MRPLAALALMFFLLAACSADSTGEDAAQALIAGRSGAVVATVGGDPGTTQHSLVVWGGLSRSPDDGSVDVVNTGARYSLVTRGWEAMAPSPLAPRWAAMHFTHEGELFVLGGLDQVDGAAWDVNDDSWRTLAATLPVAPADWDMTWSWDPQFERLLMWHLSAETMWSYSPADDAWEQIGSPGITEPNLAVIRSTPIGMVALANSRPVGFGGSPEVRTALLPPGSKFWVPMTTLDFTTADGLGDSSPQSSGLLGSNLVVWGRGGSSDSAFMLDTATQAWFAVLPPPLNACELAVPPAQGPNAIVARNFCGGAAQLSDGPNGPEWKTVDFPSEADVVPVWTGTDFIGVNPNGSIWRYQP